MKLPLVFLPVSLIALGFFTACNDETSGPQPSPTPADLSALVPTTGPALTASPNPVPAGPGMGVTTVGWNTGNGTGEVYLTNGVDEKLFARGDKGAQEAPWIMPGSTPRFRLYRGTDRRELLKEISVTMEGPAKSPAASATPAVSPSP